MLEIWSSYIYFLLFLAQIISAIIPSLSPNLVPYRSPAHGKSDLTTCWKWGGRRFRVILFRRRTRVSIPCKEMIGVKRFLPVLIYRQISRDCILNQQPHWIVYYFLAGSLSSKIWSFNILISFRYIKIKEHYFQFVLFSPCGVCGCEEDESQMLMADSLWEMTSNIKEVMEKRQIEKQNQRQRDTQYAQNSYSQLL